MVTTLPPLRVMVSVRCPRSRPCARCRRRWPRRLAARSARAGRSERARAMDPAQRRPGGHRVRCGPGDGMRLVTHPRTADMSGWGMLEEFFFDGVLVEPRDGAQPAGDGGAGAASFFQIAGEAFDVGAAYSEQVQGVGAAPGGELAQVQRVGFAGQASVFSQEPGRSSRSASLNTGWMGTRAVVVVVIGHLPVRAETGKAGPAAASATIMSPPLSRAARHVMPPSRLGKIKCCAGKGLRVADSARWATAWPLSPVTPRNIHFWACSSHRAQSKTRSTVTRRTNVPAGWLTGPMVRNRCRRMRRG